MGTITIKLPYNVDDTFGLSMIDSPKDMVKQSLLNLILCNKGECIFDINYGVGITDLLFANSHDAEVNNKREEIRRQTATYLPYISFTDIALHRNNEKLFIKISYFLNGTNISDSINLELDNTNVG